MASYHSSKGKRLFVSRTTRYRIRKEKEKELSIDGSGVADDYDFDFAYNSSSSQDSLTDNQIHDSSYLDQETSGLQSDFHRDFASDLESRLESLDVESNIYVDAGDNCPGSEWPLLTTNNENAGDSDSSECEETDRGFSMQVDTSSESAGCDVITQSTQAVPDSDCRLFEGSLISLSASNVLLLEYSMKHNLTDAALADLLKLLKLLLPSPNNCPRSTYLFRKLFNQQSFNINTQYFCNTCFTRVDSTLDCPNCQVTLINHFSSFIQLSIEQQLQMILSSELCFSICTSIYHCWYNSRGIVHIILHDMYQVI